jgi:hypothetical protein
VVDAGRVPWLFARTGPRDSSLIPGYYGIEIDGITPASPPGTTVVATIPNIFPGETADMTFYTTASGAQVFDAGTTNFGGSAAILHVARMLANLWTHMPGSTSPLPTRPTSGSRARGGGFTGMTGVRELPRSSKRQPDRRLQRTGLGEH